MSAKRKDDSSLPVNIEAERAILGSIMLDNECYFQAAPQIRVDDFALDSHRRIYRAILDLDANSRPFDSITLAEELNRTGNLEPIGGIPYLMDLTTGLSSARNVEHYVRIVSNKAKRRRLIQKAQAWMAAAMDEGTKVDDVLARAHNEVLDILSDTRRVQVYHVSDYIDEMFDNLDRVAQLPKDGTVLGLTFGINRLDELTSGMMPGENVVVAGYSSDGKSLLVSQIVHANLRNDVPCLVLTPEMTKEQYLLRMVPQATDGLLVGPQLRDLRGLSLTDRAILKDAKEKLRQLPLWVADASRMDIADANAVIRAHIRKHKIKLAVVDFIQLVDCFDAVGDYDRVTRVARVITQIAKDEKINTIQVSQLTWADKGKKKAPTMGMIRASGDVAHLAHIILFPYRPENAAGWVTGEDEIRIGKMREGGRAPVPVTLVKDYLRFEERDPKEAKKAKEAEKKTAEVKTKAATVPDKSGSLYEG